MLEMQPARTNQKEVLSKFKTIKARPQGLRTGLLRRVPDRLGRLPPDAAGAPQLLRERVGFSELIENPAVSELIGLRLLPAPELPRFRA
jgi:hypothetical protein